MIYTFKNKYVYLKMKVAYSHFDDYDMQYRVLRSAYIAVKGMFKMLADLIHNVKDDLEIEELTDHILSESSKKNRKVDHENA